MEKFKCSPLMTINILASAFLKIGDHPPEAFEQLTPTGVIPWTCDELYKKSLSDLLAMGDMYCLIKKKKNDTVKS